MTVVGRVVLAALVLGFAGYVLLIRDSDPLWMIAVAILAPLVLLLVLLIFAVDAVVWSRRKVERAEGRRSSKRFANPS